MRSAGRPPRELVRTGVVFSLFSIKIVCRKRTESALRQQQCASTLAWHDVYSSEKRAVIDVYYLPPRQHAGHGSSAVFLDLKYGQYF